MCYCLNAATLKQLYSSACVCVSTLSCAFKNSLKNTPWQESTNQHQQQTQLSSPVLRQHVTSVVYEAFAAQEGITILFPVGDKP